MTKAIAPHVKKLRFAIRKGLIIRKSWTRGGYHYDDGMDRVCLLAAMSDSCKDRQTARACPASICPQWWAQLTPWIDDTGTKEAWPAIVKEYASLAEQWGILSTDDWKALRKAVGINVMKEVVEACKVTGSLITGVLWQAIELYNQVDNHSREFHQKCDALASKLHNTTRGYEATRIIRNVLLDGDGDLSIYNACSYASEMISYYKNGNLVTGSGNQAAADQVIHAIFDTFQEAITKVKAEKTRRDKVRAAKARWGLAAAQ